MTDDNSIDYASFKYTMATLESPFGGSPARREMHTDYARLCMHDMLSRGEAPLASHLLYPQVLDDAKPEHRAIGIHAGLRWARDADYAVAYLDLGLSPGMIQGIEHARRSGCLVYFRMLCPGPELRSLDLFAAEREAIDARNARFMDRALPGSMGVQTKERQQVMFSIDVCDRPSFFHEPTCLLRSLRNGADWESIKEMWTAQYAMLSSIGCALQHAARGGE